MFKILKKYNFVAVLGLFLQPAEINCVVYKDTELIEAVCSGNIEKVKRLVEGGVGLDIKGNDQKTALINAVLGGKTEIATYLIDKGADVNAQNGYGETALIKAVKCENIKIIKYLIDKQAKLDIKDNGGDTALIHAVEWGNIEIVKYLIDAGADLTIKSKNGDTAADLATEEIKEYLDAHETFKNRKPNEIVEFIKKQLSVVNEANRKKNFESLCQVALPNTSHPGILYLTIKNNFNIYEQQNFGFSFATVKDFYIGLLTLYKNAPSKVLLNFCRELFKVCKKPLKFGSYCTNLDASFEDKVIGGLKEVSDYRKDGNRCEIESLYKKEYRFPATLAAIMQNKKFFDLRVVVRPE